MIPVDQAKEGYQELNGDPESSISLDDNNLNINNSIK